MQNQPPRANRGTCVEVRQPLRRGGINGIPANPQKETTGRTWHQNPKPPATTSDRQQPRSSANTDPVNTQTGSTGCSALSPQTLRATLPYPAALLKRRTATESRADKTHRATDTIEALLPVSPSRPGSTRRDEKIKMHHAPPALMFVPGVLQHLRSPLQLLRSTDRENAQKRLANQGDLNFSDKRREPPSVFFLLTN